MISHTIEIWYWDCVTYLVRYDVAVTEGVCWGVTRGGVLIPESFVTDNFSFFLSLILLLPGFSGIEGTVCREFVFSCRCLFYCWKFFAIASPLMFLSGLFKTITNFNFSTHVFPPLGSLFVSVMSSYSPIYIFFSIAFVITVVLVFKRLNQKVLYFI